MSQSGAQLKLKNGSKNGKSDPIQTVENRQNRNVELAALYLGFMASCTFLFAFETNAVCGNKIKPTDGNSILKSKNFTKCRFSSKFSGGTQKVPI